MTAEEMAKEYEEKDLLEIQGLMTEQEMEEEQDTVLGYLTADNVFGRIKNHWTSSKGEIEKEADELLFLGGR